MTVMYPAIFTETKDKNNTTLVYIPDLERSTEGRGVADALFMAKDCIGNMLFDVPATKLPPAKSMEEIDASASPFCDSGTTFTTLVDVDLNTYRSQKKAKSVRRNITLPQWLDDMATSARLNVSAIAQAALKMELGVV